MGVIEIRKAERKGARLLIGLAGASGGGKTRSALRLAYGLANGDASKIGLLDTENRRGSLYADKLPCGKPFMIGDLLPPFSPHRYIESIKAFEKAGVEVLIIDSVTHEWEGEGGCQEIAENNKLGGMPNWSLAKGEHKRFVNALLYSNMHVIVCLRAREKSRPVKVFDEKSGKEKTEIVNDGLTPITEKNFLFEMTASLMVIEQGTAQTIIKCPDDLMPYLGRQTGYLTEDDGASIRRWVDGLGDPEIERIRGLLEETCERGTDALKAAWEATPNTMRQKLGGKTYIDMLKVSAAEYDKPTTEVANDNEEVEI